MEIWLVAGVAVVAAVAVFALLNRRGGEVIDAPRQASASTSTSLITPTTPPPNEQDLSAGDMLRADGAGEYDPVVHFADWLEGEVSKELGTASERTAPTRRIADAARAVMPAILAQRRGVVDLPALVIEATGARDFRREIDIATLERAVAEIGMLDVRELTEWRRDQPRVRALAVSLEDQLVEDMPDDYETADDETVRIVEAARQAVLDIDGTGRADVALVAIAKDEKGQSFDLRRSLDAKELQTLVTEFEEGERMTTRTRTRSKVYE